MNGNALRNGACAILLLAPPAAAQLGTVTTTRTPSGITRTMSSGPTAWRDTSGWRLVLDHVVQPADGTPGELGKPDGIAVAPDGRVFIVERDPASINLFDATGKFVRAFGRAGSGPGEYRSPFIAVTDHSLVVHDPELVRATIFRLDGRLVRSFASVCCNWGPTPFVDAQGRLSTVGFTTVNGVGKSTWIVFDSLGHRIDSLPEPQAMEPPGWIVKSASGSGTFSIPFAAENRSTRLPDGGFVHGRTDRMEFLVSRNGLDTVRVFGRSGVVADPIPAGYRDSAFHSRVDKNERLRSVAKQSDMPQSYPLWATINRDGAGNIWVGRVLRPGARSSFDVYSPTGAFLGAVPSPFPTGVRTAWAGDRIAMIDTDADDRPRARVFRIERAARH